MPEYVPEQVVRTSTRDWATECAIADAAQTLDSAQRGIVAVVNGRGPVAYEFSNGRCFLDGPKPGS